jgi:DNA-binding LacI/PurR family transcriptional regulator
MQLQSLCRQRNMNIPQDISIIGFDNPDWPGIEVNNLTMINDAALTLDKIAVNMLINQANSAQVPESFLLTPTLRHGGTIAPPRTV